MLHSPYLVYNGQLAVRSFDLMKLLTNKNKLIFPQKEYLEQINSGRLVLLKEINKQNSKKEGYIKYKNLSAYVKRRLILKYGRPPQVINE